MSTNRRTWCAYVLTGLGAWGGTLVSGRSAAAAVEGGAPARIGWLGWSGDTALDRNGPLAGLREGLAAAGWREGQGLEIEQRLGEREQAAMLTAELVRAGVRLIVAQGGMIFPARAAAGSVPLVFAINGDPVEAGLAASFARPGGTTTGVTALSVDLAGKRLELLKQVRPGLARVAVLANGRHPGYGLEADAARQFALQLKLRLSFHAIQSATELPQALAAIAGLRGSDAPQALLAFPDTVINRASGAIAEFARTQRLPSISGWGEFAHAGNLMSYGPSYPEFYRLLASYVDRLLKGAKAGELPIERPTRFVLSLNQAAARGLQLNVPASLRARADEVFG